MGNLPNALQMHGTNLDDMTCLFALQDPVSATSSHACHVQKLRPVDHVVICLSVSWKPSIISCCVLPSLRATQTPLAST